MQYLQRLHMSICSQKCSFDPRVHLHFNCRASDNSREKKSNFAGFLETNSRRKRPISREFSGQISPKNKEESQEERFQKKEIYWTGLLIIRGKKSQISRDFWTQIRGENCRFRRNFSLMSRIDLVSKNLLAN